ncbi:MAG: DUF2589 domain-containing protein [Cyclobacteriaceae bacterium]|nr:DUF2589 domain-containing protein [Cyclobacteriaceae bacterium]
MPNDPVNPGNPAKEVPSVVSPAEFAKIPLDFIIATPLLTTIEAHRVAAETTLQFINELNDKNKSVEFETTVTETDANGKVEEKGKKIRVPLLALVKVPSLHFDSLSVSFNYNISQVYRETSKKTSGTNLEVGTTGLLAKFIGAKLTGSIEHTTNRENTANRGGTLDVKIHVSESPLPAGLQKVINSITENISDPK